MNLVIDTDSYKVSHSLQFPPGTEYVYSYIESRGGHWEETVFFGLQYILKEYLSRPVSHLDVDEAAAFFKEHGEPFPEEGWRYIVDELKGFIPLRIKAVPEGTVVPVSNVLVTVENTDPKVPWVVSWFETMLMRVWYPTTVATQSRACKKTILEFLYRTSDKDPQTEINFKLHDFGSRGVSSQESAGVGGAAHLVNFMGSDTCAGVYYARKYYNEHMAGFSIPAAEHSTMTSWGGREGELDAMRNMLTQFKGKLVACVSDSYSLKNACLNIWGGALKDQVLLHAAAGGKLVIRPDSGNPAKIVTQTLEWLDEKFGHTVNSKGYKLLPPYLGVIQGDGINESSIQEILAVAARAGWSADNIAFGMGGALLQQVNRDTQKFAMKCSEIVVNGIARPVFKDPETDHGKKSKQGRLGLFKREDGSLYTAEEDVLIKGGKLQLAYLNGAVYSDQKFSDIRSRANEGITKGLFYFS